VGPLRSLQGKLIAVDSSPFIYFIEEHPDFLPLVDPFFAAVDQSEIKIVTSILTLTEVLVLPLRLSDQQLVDRYTRILLKAENILSVEVSDSIATEAASLRSRYRLRTPDAIQLATAIDQGADAFITNDVALSKVSGVEVLLVDELANLV
jgi:predicted nucleic acid-binding protein